MTDFDIIPWFADNSFKFDITAVTVLAFPPRCPSLDI